jgi:hypothetical protein
MRKAILAAALVAVVALVAGMAPADESKAKDAPPPAKANGKAEKEAPRGAEVLTHEGLKKRLEDMGYTFKTTESTNKTPMYLVTVDSNNYRYVFYVSLSSDLKRVWVSSALRQLPAKDKVRADILEKLLEKNYDISPIHFVLKSNRWLYLDMALTNRGLTAAELRSGLDDFMSATRSTESLWNPDKYPAPVKEEKKEAKTVKTTDKNGK